MDDNEYARLVANRNIAMERRDNLKAELVKLTRHIVQIEKLVEKEQATENKRAELLVLSAQRALTTANKSSTLRDGVMAALSSAGTRDKAAINMAFADILNTTVDSSENAKNEPGQTKLDLPKRPIPPMVHGVQR